MRKVLQCDSDGHVAFSALKAKVTIKGKTKSIEDWYQLSKEKDGQLVASYWLDAKGKDFDCLNVFGVKIYDKDIEDFYTWLWVRYFINNIHWYRYACTFDEFIDTKLSTKSKVCQADSIRNIVLLSLDVAKEKYSRFNFY